MNILLSYCLYLWISIFSDNKAFVSKTEGSWFIQAMLAVFKNLHEQYDVASMFNAVTLEVSEKRQRHELETTKEVVVAAQVPVTQSTLRKFCFLWCASLINVRLEQLNRPRYCVHRLWRHGLEPITSCLWISIVAWIGLRSRIAFTTRLACIQHSRQFLQSLYWPILLAPKQFTSKLLRSKIPVTPQSPMRNWRW